MTSGGGPRVLTVVSSSVIGSGGVRVIRVIKETGSHPKRGVVSRQSRRFGRNEQIRCINMLVLV